MMGEALLGQPTYYMLAPLRLLLWMLFCSVRYFCVASRVRQVSVP